MPTEIIFGSGLALGLGIGFALAAWIGVVQLGRRNRRDRPELNERMKS